MNQDDFVFVHHEVTDEQELLMDYAPSYVSLAGTINDEGNLVVGAAFCCPDDQFCKKTGRTLAQYATKRRAIAEIAMPGGDNWRAIAAGVLHNKAISHALDVYNRKKHEYIALREKHNSQKAVSA